MSLDVGTQQRMATRSNPRARRIAATVKRALLMIVRVLEEEYGV